MILTEQEVSLLASCLDSIRDGLDSESAAQFNIGNSLRTVRDKKLYRQTHKTFEEWVEQLVNIKRCRAYQLIDHAEVISGMSTACRQKENIIHLPVNEAQTRVLRKVEPEKRQEVFEKAFEKHQGQPTAKGITEVAEQNQVIQKGLKKFDFGKDLEALYSLFEKIKGRCQDANDYEALAEQCRVMQEEAVEESTKHPIKAA